MLQRYDYFGNLPKKTVSIFSFYKLPKIFFNVAVEVGLLCPAVVFESLADVAFHIRRHGTSAIVVFVVALAGINMDEVVLDGTFHPSWHVVIDSREANGHANGLVFTKQWATFTLHLWIIQVDTVGI